MVNRRQKSQRGVVLIVALVFLIALTGVAVALMQNTTLDIKMSGASEVKTVATQEAISSTDQIVFRQLSLQGVLGNNDFAAPPGRFSAADPDNPGNFLSQTINETPLVTSANTQAELALVTSGPCPRSAKPTTGLSCNVLNLRIVKNYGRNTSNQVIVNSRIVQQFK